MPTASRFPRGFTSLLGLLNRGENPREIDYVIRPQVDLTQMYLAEALEISNSSTAALANGFNQLGTAPNNFIVPTGETWFVHSGEMRITSSVGHTGRAAPAVRGSSTTGSGFIRMVLGNQVDYTASTTVFVPFTISQFVALPGFEFGIEGVTITGGSPTNAAISLLVTRLRS